jgi:hypothetical protein
MVGHLCLPPRGLTRDEEALQPPGEHARPPNLGLPDCSAVNALCKLPARLLRGPFELRSALEG